MLATDSDLPAEGRANKRAYVRGIFTAIAPRYDLLNHLLSLNIDRRWRRLAVDQLGWERRPDATYVDLCAGTLDLAAELGRRTGFGGRIIGADFVKRMLELGRTKCAAVLPVTADALELPFPSGAFAGATVGFGVRNLADLRLGLLEAYRVLEPAGRLVILEFTTPTRQPIRAAYLFYFRRLLPFIGRLVSRHATAYTYLPASVLSFPEPAALADLMRGVGFTDVSYRLLFAGICAVHVGTKPGS